MAGYYAPPKGAFVPPKGKVWPHSRPEPQRRPTPLADYYPQNQSWWPQGQPLDSAEKRTAPLFRKPEFTPTSGAQPMPANTLFPRPTAQRRPSIFQRPMPSAPGVSPYGIPASGYQRAPEDPNYFRARPYVGIIGSPVMDRQVAPPSPRMMWNTAAVKPPSVVAFENRRRQGLGNQASADLATIHPSGYQRPLSPQQEADMLGQDYYDGPATPPMQMPMRSTAQQAGFIPGGPIPFERPNPYDTPYYNARRARNAMGQGSPYIPGGQYMTAQQRQAGYAAMPQMAPGGQAPMAPAAQSPLQRMAMTQQPTARKAVWRVGDQVPGPAVTFPISMPGDEPAQMVPMTQQPSMNPMTAQGPGPLARMGINNPNRQFGGAGRSPFPTGSDAELRSVLPVNREDRLARQNQLGQGGPTLEQAASDPNFNADGRFFQGAQLGMDQDGRAYFRERENRTFAGGVSNDSIAANNRLRTLQEMEARGRGYVLPSGGFAGIGDGTAAIKTSPEQLAENRASYLQRMQQGRQQRMGRVQENAIAAAQRRREAMNPSPLNRLMQQNPQLALALQAQQNQFNQAQALQRLENEGGVAREKARGEAEALAWDKRILGGMAMAGNEAAVNRLGFGDQQAGKNQMVVNPGEAAGVKLDEFQKLEEFAKSATPQQVSDQLNKMGIRGERHNMLLNKLKPGLFGMTQRTGQDPGGWENAYNDVVVDPETGTEMNVNALGRILGFAKPTGFMGAKPRAPLWLRALTGG